MSKEIKILILEDSKADAEMIQRLLIKEKMNCTFYLTMDKPAFLKALDEFSPLVILSDHSLPQFNSSEALSIARQKIPDIPFILVTGTASEEFAANIIKEGADDYILKDRIGRLPSAIMSALSQRKILKEIKDYKYALDQSAIVAITDQKGIITYANENFCKISGYEKSELIGQDHRLINSGYHMAAYIKSLWSTIAKGNIWHGEFCNKAKDKSLYWVDTTIIPFLNEKKKPYQYLSIRTDITEKKKAEIQIKISEEKYRTIFYKSPLPIWIFNPETLQFLDVNNAAIRHYGYSRKEFLAMNLTDIRPAEDVAALLKDVGKIKNSSDTRQGVWRHLKKNGEIIIVESTAHYIDYDSMIARMVITHDITEKIKAENELKRREMRLNEAQALANIGNWEIDLVTNNHFWSDGLFKIFGVKKNGTNPSIDFFMSFFHPNDRKVAQKLIGDALKNFNESKIGFRFIRKDGKQRFAHIEWKFEFDKKAKATRLYGILQDITEAKQAENNLKKLEEKIQEQKIQEQKKIARAIISGQEKERNFIGKELHDNINQLLATSKIYLAHAEQKNEKLKKFITYPIELIDMTIEEIRLLSHRLVTPSRNISLEVLIKTLLSDFKKNTSITTKLIYTLPEDILPNEFKLNIYRILQELTNNIQKYAAAKKVNITLKAESKTAKLVIEDDGKGFDLNIKRKGIGISNIINRAESFNGSVNIETAPGKGCKINVTIPY